MAAPTRIVEVTNTEELESVRLAWNYLLGETEDGTFALSLDVLLREFANEANAVQPRVLLHYEQNRCVGIVPLVSHRRTMAGIANCRLEFAKPSWAQAIGPIGPRRADTWGAVTQHLLNRHNWHTLCLDGISESDVLTLQRLFCSDRSIHHRIEPRNKLAELWTELRPAVLPSVAEAEIAGSVTIAFRPGCGQLPFVSHEVPAYAVDGAATGGNFGADAKLGYFEAIRIDEIVADQTGIDRVVSFERYNEFDDEIDDDASDDSCALPIKSNRVAAAIQLCDGFFRREDALVFCAGEWRQWCDGDDGEGLRSVFELAAGAGVLDVAVLRIDGDVAGVIACLIGSRSAQCLFASVDLRRSDKTTHHAFIDWYLRSSHENDFGTLLVPQSMAAFFEPRVERDVLPTYRFVAQRRNRFLG